MYNSTIRGGELQEDHDRPILENRIPNQRVISQKRTTLTQKHQLIQY